MTPETRELIDAVTNGDVEKVEELLEAGADPDVRSSEGRTPLLIAALLGKRDVVLTLLRHGARPDACEMGADDLIREAALNGAEDVVWCLLSASPAIEDARCFDEVWPRLQVSSLIAALTSGQTGIAKLILAKCPDLAKACDETGWTALHEAVLQRNVEMSQLLVDAGARVDARDDEGKTALDHAFGGTEKTGRDEIIRMLLARRAPFEPNPEDVDQTPIEWAAEHDDERLLKSLLKKGATIDPTLLIVATQHHSSKALRFLLNKGLSPSVSDHEGRTPLHHAAGGNDTECVALLLSNGADARVRDRRGQTPLHAAAELCIDEAVSVAGALLAHGADVNASDAEGQTALHVAARLFYGTRKEPALAQLLLAEGADVLRKDRMGHTAEDLARADGNDEIADLLHRHKEGTT